MSTQSQTFSWQGRAMPARAQRPVKRAHLGTLIGSPTGGNRRGINGGAFFFVRLPRTGLEIDLPLIATFPEGEEPDSGILPDLEVLRTATDLARGHDPVRARAEELARESRR